MFKAHGFKKNGLNFLRRTGAVVNFFNIQLSQWNCGEDGHFYLNAGVMFDEMFAFRGDAIPDKPKYFDCQFMVRLENLDNSLPDSHHVDASTDAGDMASHLARVIESTYVLPLNSISSAKEFDRLGWVQAIPWGFPAVFAYVLGDVSRSRRLVKEQARYFEDRGATFESVASSLGLEFSEFQAISP
jgi:hypothetical protein